MKTSLRILLCIISLLLSVIFGFHERVQDDLRMQNLDSSGPYFQITVTGSSVDSRLFLEELQDISESYDATIIRRDMIDTTDSERTITYLSGIFVPAYFSDADLQILSGRTIQSADEIMSSFDTGSPTQVGTIKDLFSDNPLIIQTLENSFTNHLVSIDGLYTITCQEDDKAAILTRISHFLDIPEEELIGSRYSQVYDPGPVQIFYFGLVILFLLFTMTGCFYPTSRIKEIGIYKLQGFSSERIWFQFNKPIWISTLFFILITAFIQIFLISGADASYFLKLLTIQGLMFLFSVFLSLTMMIIIHRYTIKALLNRFFHVRIPLFFSYALKLITIIGLVIISPQLSMVTDTLVKELQAMQAYQQEAEYVTLSQFDYIGNEFQNMLNGDRSVNQKLSAFFHELELTASAEFVYTQDMNTDYLLAGRENVDYDVQIQDGEAYTVFYINENFLQRYAAFFDRSVEDYFQDDICTVLFPDSFKSNQNLDYLSDCIRLTFENNEMDLNIDFYPDNNTPFFSQNIQLVHTGKTWVENPVFVCLNNTGLDFYSFALTNSSISNPIRIKDTEENRQHIAQAIDHQNLSDNHLQFESILDSGYREYLNGARNAIFICLIGLSGVLLVSALSGYFVLLILLTFRKKEIFVKKMLGYSFLSRYLNEWFYFFLFYLTGLLLLIVFSPAEYSLIIYGSALVIDFTLLNRMIHIREIKSLNIMLKGDE